MHLITGGLVGISPLIVAVVVRGEAVLWLPVMIAFVGAWAALHIRVGMDCLKGRSRGRITSIVVSGGILVLLLPGWEEEPLYALGALAWFGTIVGLSVAARPCGAQPDTSGTPEAGGPPPI